MTSIDIVSTSRQSATVSDIPIRTTDNIRLVFRPEIVVNPTDPAATLRGTFLYQRKGKNDGWDDSPISSLSGLKKGEGYQLELHAGELLSLLRQLADLVRLSRQQGVPQGRQQYVRMERSLAQFLQLSDNDLNSFLNSHPENAVLTLQKVLRWLTTSTALSDFMIADGSQLAVANAALGVAALRTVLGIWRAQSTNSSEEFWQRTLGDHAFVFSQVFAYPIVMIREKAYVGGKRLDNHHGNVVDFLARSESAGNALILEIKTPTTALLGAEYRDEAFPLSTDVSGAIAQVLKYRDSLMENIRGLGAEDQPPLLVTEPRCLVIAGHCDSLGSTAKRLSFERFRERLVGVTVITFDELFRRVEQLNELLSAPGSTGV